MGRPTTVLVALKSFGDFVIARWALRRFGADADHAVRMLVGAHLKDLSDAMGQDERSDLVEHGETTVPSLFDARKRGVRRAVSSALRLRKAFDSLRLPPETTLVFDRVGIRERCIAHGLRSRSLPSADNIYLAYAQLLSRHDSTAFATAKAPVGVSGTVGIFPGSRMAAKCLPRFVVESLRDACDRRGMANRVFVLDGEQGALEGAGFEITIVPRSFLAMFEAIRSCNVVLSADSMPAHLAEYVGMPVYVVSPSDNRYWLPLSCFEQARWSTFANAATTNGPVDRFLEFVAKP